MQDDLPEKTDSLGLNGAFPISVGLRPGKQTTETSSTATYTQLELLKGSCFSLPLPQDEGCV